MLPSVELLISYIYIYIFFFIYDPFLDGTSKIQNLGVLIRLACIKLVHSLFLRVNIFFKGGVGTVNGNYKCHITKLGQIVWDKNWLNRVLHEILPNPIIS